MSLLARKQIDLSEYTGKAEFILILKVRSVTPLKHKHLYGIFTTAEIFRYIYLAGHMRYLTVSRKSIVYKKIEVYG